MARKSKKTKRSSILDKLSHSDCHYVLKVLISDEPSLADRVEEIIREHISSCDREDIAKDVLSDLNSMEVEDIWDRSGSTRDGYVEPGEAAHEIVEETLELYVEQLKQYQKLEMWADAKDCCLGILQGLYDFGTGPNSLLKDWVSDSPAICFSDIVDGWRKSCENKRILEVFEDEYQEAFPKWSKW